MSVFTRPMRVYRDAMLMDLVVVVVSVVMVHLHNRWWLIPVVWFGLACAHNGYRWFRLWRLSKSPYAYLLEIEALCNGGELK